MNISNKFFDKRMKDYRLCISRDKDKGFVLVYFGNSDKKVFLKTFKNPADYERFLLEAFILRLSVHNKDVKGVRGICRNLVDYLEDESNFDDKISF